MEGLNDYLDPIIDMANEKMASQLENILEKIKELGGRDYTEV